VPRHALKKGSNMPKKELPPPSEGPAIAKQGEKQGISGAERILNGKKRDGKKEIA